MLKPNTFWRSTVALVFGILCLSSSTSFVRSQPNLPCSDSVCSLFSRNCQPGQESRCDGSGRCRCVTVQCSNDGACPSGSFCIGGSCAAAEACNSNFDCPRAGVCSEGVCRPGSGPPQTGRTPCSDATCNDGNPCNGREYCDGYECKRIAAPNCDDRNPLTADKCIADNRDCARCQNTVRWFMSTDPNTVRTEGDLINFPGSTLPDGAKTPPPILPNAPPKPGVTCTYSAITKSSLTMTKNTFRWAGVLDTRFSGSAPYNLERSLMRVILADSNGGYLTDAVGMPFRGKWEKGAKGAFVFTPSDSKAKIKRILISGNAGSVFGQDFIVEGALDRAFNGASSKNAAGVLFVGWSDAVSGPCGSVMFSSCTRSGTGYICRQIAK